MNPKTLGLAALAMVVVALLYQTIPVEKEITNELLLPGLKEAVSDIDRVVIEPLDREENGLTIIQEEGVWQLAEKSGYPIDFERFLSFVDKLAAAEVTEKKTARREYHSTLGVADEGGEEEIGTLVSIGSESESFELIVGNESGSGRGSFVRRPQSDQVYLVDQQIEVSPDAVDWLDPIVINIDSKKIRRVEIQGVSGLVAERNPESGDIELKGLPEDAELKYPTIADGLARVLVNLRLQDVAPYDESLWREAGVARYLLEGGEAVKVRTVKKDDDFWLHLDTSQLGGLSDLSAYKDRSRWQYQVSQYVFNEFNKTMADMLKSEEE